MHIYNFSTFISISFKKIAISTELEIENIGYEFLFFNACHKKK